VVAKRLFILGVASNPVTGTRYRAVGEVGGEVVGSRPWTTGIPAHPLATGRSVRRLACGTGGPCGRHQPNAKLRGLARSCRPVSGPKVAPRQVRASGADQRRKITPGVTRPRAERRAAIVVEGGARKVLHADAAFGRGPKAAGRGLPANRREQEQGARDQDRAPSGRVRPGRAACRRTVRLNRG